VIKLVAVKMLRCEMMYERVLSQPDGADLQDRIENYFLAWSNSVRRDLEALGLLEATRNAIDELLKIAPADMTDEQLDIAMAFCKHQLALWGHSGGEAQQRHRAGCGRGTGLGLSDLREKAALR
jgi:hypothetical protein